MSADTDLPWMWHPTPSVFDYYYCYTETEARRDAARIARHILNHQHQLDTTPLDCTTVIKAEALRCNIGNRPVPEPPQMW